MKRMFDKKSLMNEVKSLIESLGGLKYGNYIYKDEPTDHFEYVLDIPEDYSGLAISFMEDGIGFYRYENGITIAICYLNENGVNKLNFASLTHSFNELDTTLKALVESAISTGEAVPCTEAQWNAIKALLDKSLYLNYDGISLIKSQFNGIDEYCFGEVSGTNSGEKIHFYYNLDIEELAINLEQV